MHQRNNKVFDKGKVTSVHILFHNRCVLIWLSVISLIVGNSIFPVNSTTMNLLKNLLINI
jgi:hypothetical protein